MDSPSPVDQYKVFLRNAAKLDEETIEQLIEQGFDDIDSLRLAEFETIQLLGLKDANHVFNCIKTALGDPVRLQALEQSMGKNSNANGMNLGILAQDGEDMQELQVQMEHLRMQKESTHSEHESQAEEKDLADDGNSEIQLEGKAISVQMIVGAKEMKKGKAHLEKLIKMRTHIHLEGKKIQLITNLRDFTSLQNIYLQENHIYTLVNDPFPGLHKLTQLSLYDNKIDQIEGMEDLVNLKKLYLEKNMISKLQGLENCRKLEELYLGNQQLSMGKFFEFDEYSLAAISASLRNLDIPNSRVIQIKPLYYLEGLEHLNLKDNLVSNFELDVCPILQTMNRLGVLNLKNNPVQGITKYRDQIVLLSRSVVELDGKDVTDQERKYLVSLISRKKVGGTVYKDVKQKKENIAIEGENLPIHDSKKLGTGSRQPTAITFGQFCQMFGKGDDPKSIDDDFNEYLAYQAQQKDYLSKAGADFGEMAGTGGVLGKAKNINSNNDFTSAGGANANTKHVPYAVRKGGGM